MPRKSLSVERAQKLGIAAETAQATVVINDNNSIPFLRPNRSAIDPATREPNMAPRMMDPDKTPFFNESKSVGANVSAVAFCTFAAAPRLYPKVRPE